MPYLLLKTMKMKHRRTKSDPNPVAIVTMMASEHSMLRAVAKWLRIEQSLLWSLGFSPLRVNHCKQPGVATYSIMFTQMQTYSEYLKVFTATPQSRMNVCPLSAQVLALP